MKLIQMLLLFALASSLAACGGPCSASSPFARAAKCSPRLVRGL
jgi:hypothetical protein